MMARDDIDALLVATAGHDQMAFRRLYDLTCGRLMAVVLRICRDRATAEDVLQDVYVQVWNRAGAFDAARGSALGWLTVMARHRAIDQIRRTGREPADEADETALEHLAAAQVDADQSAALQALMGCLQNLDPRHAKAILLAYHEGYSREELAQRFSIPENTIKTWLRRGLISLRTCMGEG